MTPDGPSLVGQNIVKSVYSHEPDMYEKNASEEAFWYRIF
jgi:hypothetical protein